MSEQSLKDLLERWGEQTTVSSPPIDQMVARVRHQRRRRTAVITVVATFMTAAIAGGAIVLGGPDSPPVADRAIDSTPGQDSTADTGRSFGPTPLDGTWRLTALVGDNGKSVLPPDARPVDIVIEDGQIAGDSGCGDFIGMLEGFDEGDRRVTFSGSTGELSADCAGVQRVIERLDAVRHFNRADENTLTLHDANWMIVFDLRLISPATDAAPTTAASACPPVAPRELPNGDPAGKFASRSVSDGEQDVRQFGWGSDANTVIQQIGNPLAVPDNPPPDQLVPLRDTTTYVTAIGDPGQIAFVFTIDDCTYTNWIGPGIDFASALDYVSRF